MAPTASKLILFPIYHHGPAAEAPREVGAGAGGFRFGFRNVLFPTGFLAMMTRRDKAPAAVPEVAAAEVKQRGRHAGGDREAEEKAAALGSKFEEAVRLSCWAS